MDEVIRAVEAWEIDEAALQAARIIVARFPVLASSARAPQYVARMQVAAIRAIRSALADEARKA